MFNAKEARELASNAAQEKIKFAENSIKESAIKGKTEIILQGEFWSNCDDPHYNSVIGRISSAGYNIRFISASPFEGDGGQNAYTKISW
jgi:hypothetical protein